MTQLIVRIGIEGVGQGLLMHNPAGMASAPAAGTAARAGKRIPQPLDEARASLYVLPGSNQLYAASDWFREALLTSSKNFKDSSRRGNATMTVRTSGTVFQSELYFPLFRAAEDGKPITSDDSEWENFRKRVVIQSNGIVRSRALVRDWACTAEFEYDNEAMDPLLVTEMMHAAGKYPGVGDYRPEKKGPFGRFRAVSVDGKPWPLS
jgi:hypothetical protein